MKKYKGCRNNHLSKKGPSSYFMHDPEIIFNELKIKEGYSVLDLGCGAGDYSIKASQIVKDTGVVYAIDKGEMIMNRLEEEIKKEGITNVQTHIASIEKAIPIEDECIDVCLIATVLHALNLQECKEILFNEIRRVLKPEGLLAIIECKKINAPFGPPKASRWSPEEIENIAKIYGFEKTGYIDLGYNYMILLRIENTAKV